MITAIITHYFPNRVKNLQPIIDSLPNPPVTNKVVWNNDDPIPAPQGCRFIQSGWNYGCQGRFAATAFLEPDLLGEPKYVLFHDNDIIAHPNSIYRLLSVAEANPGAICAGTGERRVWNGKVYFLSRGQFELVPVETLFAILKHWKNDETSKHDDLWFSVQAHRRGTPILHVNIQWKNLRDTVGFWRQWQSPTEFDRVRQAVFTSLMEAP